MSLIYTLNSGKQLKCISHKLLGISQSLVRDYHSVIYFWKTLCCKTVHYLDVLNVNLLQSDVTREIHSLSIAWIRPRGRPCNDIIMMSFWCKFIPRQGTVFSFHSHISKSVNKCTQQFFPKINYTMIIPNKRTQHLCHMHCNILEMGD